MTGACYEVNPNFAGTQTRTTGLTNIWTIDRWTNDKTEGLTKKLNKETFIETVLC